MKRVRLLIEHPSPSSCVPIEITGNVMGGRDADSYDFVADHEEREGRVWNLHRTGRLYPLFCILPGLAVTEGYQMENYRRIGMITMRGPRPHCRIPATWHLIHEKETREAIFAFLAACPLPKDLTRHVSTHIWETRASEAWGGESLLF
jgi:hypothetical protein